MGSANLAAARLATHPPAYAPGLWQQYNALIVGIHHKIPKLLPDFSVSKNFP